MHILSRQIRFLIAPFEEQVFDGFNSYAGKPTANALSFYFNLTVELQGDVSPQTGFVINVAQIDKLVRAKCIDIFSKKIKKSIAQNTALNFTGFASLLGKIWKIIEADFLPAKLHRLCLKFTPFRKIAIKQGDFDMFYYSEKFEFAASHTLGNSRFSNIENIDAFGKCANPAGHGHNYIVEVCVCGKDLDVIDFEKTVVSNFIDTVDHKNLNADIEYFKNGRVNPTVENIAEFAFNSLEDKFSNAALDSIKVWENDRTFCTYKKDSN